jgi:hypothetical protein
MMAFNAESVDFGNFHPVQADYGPRDIHAVAAMVTSNNIGQWSLEFEQDLEDATGGKPRFYFTADREGDDPIVLSVEAGVWIVKVWNELHIFKDGMFQKTFAVDKEQLKAVRKAHRDTELQLERQWQKEREEERDAFQQEMEEKFERVQETGDWSELSQGETLVLKQRLLEDEEIQELVAAARERKAKEKEAIVFHTDQGVTAPPVVGPDYHAGSLFRSEGQEPSFYKNLDHEQMEVRKELVSGKKILMRVGAYEQLADEAKKMFGPVLEMRSLAESLDAELSENLNREVEEKTESEQTQFIPQVSIPIGPARPFKDDPSDTGQQPIYPEGDEPSGGNTRGVGN